ncbi:hypothetical protein VR44_13830 [Streptomyces katrae]|uniref:Uncharacterized protein n=1 Tax=Streptomyces katrae TaxID=68223 RepID=A0A0F4JKN1_9ACTN|nr:hypothetical protein VR44_13830 [Streptomyces katrae]
MPGQERSVAPDALGAHRRTPGHWTPAGRIAAALRRTAVRLWDDVAALYAGAGTHNRLYGSLAGTIVFLVWLWVTNLALLAGAQFNAVRARPGE